jgi:hypothetical protein
MLDVDIKRKALALIAVIVVVFGVAAAFVAWGVPPEALAAAP